MKITEMTPEQKTKVLAELDGWKRARYNDGRDDYDGDWQRGGEQKSGLFYFTSYDAIIPCLTRLKLWNTIMQRFQFATPSPEQICDEVLVETGKCER